MCSMHTDSSPMPERIIPGCVAHTLAPGAVLHKCLCASQKYSHPWLLLAAAIPARAAPYAPPLPP